MSVVMRREDVVYYTLEIYSKSRINICISSTFELYGEWLLIDILINQWVLVGWILFLFVFFHIIIVVYVLCSFTFISLESRMLHDAFLLLSYNNLFYFCLLIIFFWKAYNSFYTFDRFEIVPSVFFKSSYLCFRSLLK